MCTHPARLPPGTYAEGPVHTYTASLQVKGSAALRARVGTGADTGPAGAVAEVAALAPTGGPSDPAASKAAIRSTNQVRKVGCVTISVKYLFYGVVRSVWCLTSHRTWWAAAEQAPAQGDLVLPSVSLGWGYCSVSLFTSDV